MKANVHRRFSAGLALMLFACSATRLSAQVGPAVHTESFVQFETWDINSTDPTAPPTVSASGTMTISTSGLCQSSGAPQFVSANLPVDAGDFPIQFTYLAVPTAAPWMDAATLNVSCTVTNSGVTTNYVFQIPIYLCNPIGGLGTIMALNPESCFNSSLLSSCTITQAGTLAPAGFSVNTSTEILQVYQPPSSVIQNLTLQQTPAVAIDIQFLYNGFSSSFTSSSGPWEAPLFVRVACSSLSAFSNE